MRSLEECLCGTSEPPVFQFACEVGHGQSLLGSPLDHLSGLGGAGLTRAGAATAAVGEALERYSATFVPVDRLVVASANELGDLAGAAERFALFSDAQYADSAFPFQRFTRATRIAWIEARSVREGSRAFVPAEARLPRPGESPRGIVDRICDEQRHRMCGRA